MNCTLTKIVPSIPSKEIDGKLAMIAFHTEDEMIHIVCHPPSVNFNDFGQSMIKATKEQLEIFQKIINDILATQMDIKNVVIK